MANNRERLIDKDMEDGEEVQEASALNSPAFWLAIKISFGTAILSGLVVAIVLVFMAVGEVEEQLSEVDEELKELQSRQQIIAKSIKQLTSESQFLSREIESLDLGAAKGDLRQALNILGTQSGNIDKQLAVTRNGLISLARMVKGSRVWQDDYRAQFQELFQHNEQVKEDIKELRGVAKKQTQESRYIELDF